MHVLMTSLCSQSTYLSPASQATNEVVGRVPKATQEEMLAAVDSCSRAFHAWSETSILSRQQIFLRYQQLIKDNIVGKCFLQIIFTIYLPVRLNADIRSVNNSFSFSHFRKSSPK